MCGQLAVYRGFYDIRKLRIPALRIPRMKIVILLLNAKSKNVASLFILPWLNDFGPSFWQLTTTITNPVLLSHVGIIHLT